MRVTLTAPLDYLSPGITYLATPSKSGRYIRFDREGGSSGCTIRDYTWAQGVRTGVLHATPAMEG
jgi:hypothetical protein